MPVTTFSMLRPVDGRPDGRLRCLQEGALCPGCTAEVPAGLRERATRLALPSGMPIPQVARELGIHKEALRDWVRQEQATTALDSQAAEPLAGPPRASSLSPRADGPWSRTR